MSYETTDKQRKLLKSLGAESIPDDGEEASKLIEKLLGEKNSEDSAKKSKKSGYQPKLVKEVLPEDVTVDEASVKEYLQKYVTAHSICRSIFPELEPGTQDYFIKTFAIVHDL